MLGEKRRQFKFTPGVQEMVGKGWQNRLFSSEKRCLTNSSCKQPTLFSHGKHGITRKNLKRNKKIFFKMLFHYFTRIPCFSVSSVANE